MTARSDGQHPPLDRGYCLTVMSHDPRESACKGCGEVRVIYQVHTFAFAGESVRARCKDCIASAAEERGGAIFLKNELPRFWDRDTLGSGASPKASLSRQERPTARGAKKAEVSP